MHYGKLDHLRSGYSEHGAHMAGTLEGQIHHMQQGIVRDVYAADEVRIAPLSVVVFTSPADDVQLVVNGECGGRNAMLKNGILQNGPLVFQNAVHFNAGFSSVVVNGTTPTGVQVIVNRLQTELVPTVMHLGLCQPQVSPDIVGEQPGSGVGHPQTDVAAGDVDELPVGGGRVVGDGLRHGAHLHPRVGPDAVLQGLGSEESWVQGAAILSDDHSSREIDLITATRHGGSNTRLAWRRFQIRPLLGNGVETQRYGVERRVICRKQKQIVALGDH